MKLPSPTGFRSSARSGFTMVEIAIALGVIGFALVAIIGILPMSLQVQRDNRAETIIHQDATYWMDAIRNGTRDIPALKDYVDRIVVSNETYVVAPLGSPGRVFTTSGDIIGLLSTETTNYMVVSPDDWEYATHPAYCNTAYVRAISGSAAEKEAGAEIAFKYRMRVFVEPADQESVTDPFFSVAAGTPSPLSGRLYQIRLDFAWPVIDESRGEEMPPKATYRAMIGRNLEGRFSDNGDYRTHFFVP